MQRSGIDHAKATVPFHLVELARDMKEHDGKNTTQIIAAFSKDHGITLSLNTLNDWLYFRTRLYS